MIKRVLRIPVLNCGNEDCEVCYETVEVPSVNGTTSEEGQVMNTKLLKVNPNDETKKYIRGTGAGNYFLISSETSKGIVAFRPLSLAIPPVGTLPTNYTETRVRVVPTLANARLDRLMEKFGFERHNGGVAPVHYSKVTTRAKEAIEDAKLALDVAA